MYNAPRTKTFIIATLILCAAGLMASCGKSPATTDNAATELLSQAETSCDNGQPEQALLLIDSLNKAFPKQVQILRKAMYLRTQATAQLIVARTAENDSLKAQAQAIVNKLSGGFKTIGGKDLVESYRVCKSDGDLSGTDLQARIDESGDVYLATSHSGAATGYTRISISNGAESVTSDAAENYRFADTEMVTFRGEKCDSLCLFVADNEAKTLKATFLGHSKSSVTMSLKQKQCIARTIRYAHAAKTLKHCQGVAIYLQKQQEINADQMNRTRITGYR